MIYSRNRFLYNEGTPSGDGGSGEPVKSNDGGQGAVDAKALQEKIDAITANSQKILNEKKELEGKLKAISDAKKIEDGKTSELLNETKAELEREKAEKEALKLKAEEAEKYVNAERERLISQLPDEDKEYAEDIKDLIKLSKFVAKQLKAPAKTDNGKGASGEIKLTEAEKADAVRMGISEQDYFEIQEKRKKKKD